MSTLVEARTAYADALENHDPLTALGVTVSTHGGSFDAAELARYSKAAPAVVLALLAFGADCTEGYVRADARWGVVCFAQDRPGLPKDEAVALLAAAVTEALLLGFVDLDVEHKPQEIHARNMFGAPVDTTGVAMWAVEFSSQFELSTAIPDDVTDLSGVGAKWDVAPRDNEAPAGQIPEALDTISTL